MADKTQDASGTRSRFEQMFQSIAASMKVAAGEANHLTAASEAERVGLVKAVSSSLNGDSWEKAEGEFSLMFNWRFYDKTKTFGPMEGDRNILSLELRESDKITKKTEERYED